MPGRAGGPPSLRPGVAPGRLAARPASQQIGTLRLSIPGASGALGRGVATRVATRLGAELPAGLTGQYEKLTLRVRPGGLSEEALSEAIVQSVLRALGRRGGER
jgi:hypothetical protein